MILYVNNVEGFLVWRIQAMTSRVSGTAPIHTRAVAARVNLRLNNTCVSTGRVSISYSKAFPGKASHISTYVLRLMAQSLRVHGAKRLTRMVIIKAQYTAALSSW